MIELGSSSYSEHYHNVKQNYGMPTEVFWLNSKDQTNIKNTVFSKIPGKGKETKDKLPEYFLDEANELLKLNKTPNKFVLTKNSFYLDGRAPDFSLLSESEDRANAFNVLAVGDIKSKVHCPNVCKQIVHTFLGDEFIFYWDSYWTSSQICRGCFVFESI